MPMARRAEWQDLAHAYQRHQPEHTRLYYIIEQYYPKFVTHLAEKVRSLPLYIEQEFGRSRTSLCFAAFVNPFTSHRSLHPMRRSGESHTHSTRYARGAGSCQYRRP